MYIFFVSLFTFKLMVHEYNFACKGRKMFVKICIRINTEFEYLFFFFEFIQFFTYLFVNQSISQYMSCFLNIFLFIYLHHFINICIYSFIFKHSTYFLIPLLTSPFTRISLPIYLSFSPCLSFPFLMNKVGSYVWQKLTAREKALMTRPAGGVKSVRRWVGVSDVCWRGETDWGGDGERVRLISFEKEASTGW